MDSNTRQLIDRIELLESKLEHVCRKVRLDFIGDDKDYMVVDYDDEIHNNQ